MLYKNLHELQLDLQEILTFHGTHVTVHNKTAVIEKGIDNLVYTSVFSPDETLRSQTRRMIREIGKEMGVYSASIRPLYAAIAKGEVKGFTVPAMNIRPFGYYLCRAIFKVAKKMNAGALIIEIAKTESEYTGQAPEEFAPVVLAAAIKEGYNAPVFIQGDHSQFSAKRWTADKEVELQRVKNWVDLLLDADFRNIDIDGSTLVDLSKPSLHAQQEDNAFVTAEITKYIREKETKHKHPGAQEHELIAIGGEIGHIGEKNSTVDDFHAFMDLYLKQIHRGTGISKVAVQTGTSHGGVVSADGKVQAMTVDFSVLKSIAQAAKGKYGVAGPVQHGASTLPTESFHTFVENETAEIHLSTGFQNVVFDTMPKSLRDEMYAWLKTEKKADWKEGMTEDQFLYKSRKFVWGPFKQKMWDLTPEEKAPILAALEAYLEKIFTHLSVQNSMDVVKKYVKQ